MSAAPQGVRDRARGWQWSVLSMTAAAGLLASVSRVGSDWGWAVAMGRHIRSTGSVPDSVPFAEAPSNGWHNVPVLGQLIASWVDQGGAAVVVLGHLLLVVTALLLLLTGARVLGGRDGRAALFLGLLVIGALSTWGLVRLQTFSLPFFAAMLVLVMIQARNADRRIWVAPLLVAVWGNLHGGVLLGVCVLGAYLLCDRLRRRPLETGAVGVASLVALLCTPQGLDTVAYYLRVFDNAAAERGEGLWSRPDLGEPFDLLMIVAVVVLGLVALRRRRPLWEYVAIAGLTAATVSAARHGVWLLCLLFICAAAGQRATERASSAEAERPVPPWRAEVLAVAVLAAAVAIPVVIWRGDAVADADPDLVAAVVDLAGDDVVLAPAPLVERLSVQGVHVWAGNPLDAFAKEDQEAYLDFLAGRAGMLRAVDGSQMVVTQNDTPAGLAMERVNGFQRTSCFAGWTCHERQ